MFAALKEQGVEELAVHDRARIDGFLGTLDARRACGAEDPLSAVRETALVCTRCRLSQARHRVVFGSGPARAEIMFVGEAPGFEEDQQGEPFVGPAGQLLTRMIEAMGLKRERVYIANCVKCRPPGNRDPLPDELESCLPYLKTQIERVAPRVIVCLGRVASQTLLKREEPISRLRGRFTLVNGRQVMCTFHPSYLLRNPQEKRLAWEDLKKVRELLKTHSP
ncbi:MAG: uracil-DNA glycosylase [Candidatus Omnitrophica bacterium]|nr:uracil-DNA glycosylase [Candidatus Omnitrophota bacterium]